MKRLQKILLMPGILMVMCRSIHFVIKDKIRLTFNMTKSLEYFVIRVEDDSLFCTEFMIPNLKVLLRIEKYT